MSTKKRWLGAVAVSIVIGLHVPAAWGEWTRECAAQGCIEGPAIFSCCSPAGSCSQVNGTAGCYTGSSVFGCAGDGNGDGIDDACACGANQATACCLPGGGCQDAVEPAACAALGGVSFGLCATCDQIQCPVQGCIGATGDCGTPHPGAGCSFLYCCNQVCSQLPGCCESPLVPATTPWGALLLAALLPLSAGIYFLVRR